jgi:dephospho-CoA kinase
VLRVGLTGGIACGKSSAAEMLVRRGAHFLSADVLAHQLYAPGSALHGEIVRRFGDGILDDDGSISRAKLAREVFPDRIDELNALVHPAVVAAQNRWMSEVGRDYPHGIAVVEAALIFEAGVARDFDRIIVVTCGLEQKIARFAQRSGLTLEKARAEVERRMAAQMSEDEKARRADYVIDNSGSIVELEQQVERTWRDLQTLVANERHGR